MFNDCRAALHYKFAISPPQIGTNSNFLRNTRWNHSFVPTAWVRDGPYNQHIYMYLLRYKSTTIAGAVCRMHSGKAQVAGRISQKSAGHFMK